MLSAGEKHLIINEWKRSRFSARRLIKEFSNKNWKRRILDQFLRKWSTTTSNAL